jgi:AcrR family transcriptional regulator
MGASAMGLRARKKLATETALLEAALDLFQARGYDETTVQHITDTAGVSQRTFFRYFPTKDAVLLTEHTRREADLRAMLARRPAEEPGDLALAILLHLAAEVSDEARSARTRTEAFAAVPSLADRFAGHHDRLAGIIAGHVADSLGVGVDADPRPALVASQVVACWTTAVHLWVVGGMEGDLRAALIDILTTARSDRALVDADRPAG